MSEPSAASRTSDTRPVRLPAPVMDERPSGARLGVFALLDRLAPAAPFTLAKFHVPVGVTTAEDHHLVREIWLVESGSGRLTVDGEVLRLSAGDSLYYDSFRHHQLHNDGDVPITLISIWWQP
jgi:mannose-6-phosphate isomerase-like protein (cupin superfamily)